MTFRGELFVLTGAAFRHQIILPAHQALYDYWRSKCHDGRLPSRDDICPADIRKFLPHISLTEVCHETGAVSEDGTRDMRYRLRLAGTGFYDLYGTEITGAYIDELPIGAKAQYWERVLGRVVHRAKPSAGVTRPGTPYGAHQAQFWIRLPLSEDGTTVSMILGYDHLTIAALAEPVMQQSASVSA